MLAAAYQSILKAAGAHEATHMLFLHRLAACVHASECGRLCPSLIKGPGIAQIACVNVETSESVNLYEALEREDFICPRELF